MKKHLKKISISFFSVILIIAMSAFVLAGCGNNANKESQTVQPTSEPAQTTAKFKYKHDPRENPKAMEDCIEDDTAVYGFSPNPESTRLAEYAKYDWSDPDFVAEAQQNRIEYHESIESMMDIVRTMRDEGKSLEEIARAVSAERNRIRLEAAKDDPEKLATVKKSNLEKYGDENGPSADSLYEKYGSWEAVLQGAFSPNLGMDACCGLYDIYYQEYIELGLVETDK